MSNDATLFKTLYTSLVVNTSEPDSEAFVDQVDVMANIVKTKLDVEELKDIMTTRILNDRKNTELFLLDADRSALNREIHLGHVYVRNYLFMTIMTTIAVVLMIAVSFLFIDLHQVLVTEGIRLLDYSKAIDEYIKPFILDSD